MGGAALMGSARKGQSSHVAECSSAGDLARWRSLEEFLQDSGVAYAPGPSGQHSVSAHNPGTGVGCSHLALENPGLKSQVRAAWALHMAPYEQEKEDKTQTGKKKRLDPLVLSRLCFPGIVNKLCW